MFPDIASLAGDVFEDVVMQTCRDEKGVAFNRETISVKRQSFELIYARQLQELAERKTPQDAREQAIHAQLQKAWWESIKIAKKTGDEYYGCRAFVRAMNAAFLRYLF